MRLGQANGAQGGGWSYRPRRTRTQTQDLGSYGRAHKSGGADEDGDEDGDDDGHGEEAAAVPSIAG